MDSRMIGTVPVHYRPKNPLLRLATPDDADEDADAGTLSLNGKQVAHGRIERTVGLRFCLSETFDGREDTGTPVLEDCADRMPFKFSGELEKPTIESK